MKRVLAVAALFAVAVLYGCAATVPVYRPFVGPTAIVMENDYLDYSRPLYFDAYPGVIFHERWDRYGCGCIVPVALVGGGWITYLGDPVVYQGVWFRPPREVVFVHRDRLVKSPDLFHRGAGRPRVVQVRPTAPVPHVTPSAPHVAPPTVQARPPQQVRPTIRQQIPQQARPTAPRAPAKAPEKKKPKKGEK